MHLGGDGRIAELYTAPGEKTGVTLGGVGVHAMKCNLIRPTVLDVEVLLVGKEGRVRWVFLYQRCASESSRAYRSGVAVKNICELPSWALGKRTAAEWNDLKSKREWARCTQNFCCQGVYWRWCE